MHDVTWAMTCIRMRQLLDRNAHTCLRDKETDNVSDCEGLENEPECKPTEMLIKAEIRAISLSIYFECLS